MALRILRGQFYAKPPPLVRRNIKRFLRWKGEYVLLTSMLMGALHVVSYFARVTSPVGEVWSIMVKSTLRAKDLKAAKWYCSHPPGAGPVGVYPESGASHQPRSPTGPVGRSRPRPQLVTSTSWCGAVRARGS